MINIISYLMPWFGLIVCLIVVFTRKIDTRCPIRVTKMVLWLAVWMLVAYYDYPYDAVKETSDTTARVLLLIINCLYIAESILYRHKRIKKINLAPWLGLFLELKMANFENLFNRLMEHEGGYVNHPNDPGGETMYGVTKRVANAHGYWGDMRNLPKSLAKQITEKSYYSAVKGDQLDRLIAWQLTDAAYNHGNRQAVKFLQRAVGASDDGLIGPHTLTAVAAMDKNDVVLLFNAERIEFYTGLRGWISFGKGWARRVAGNLRFAASDN